MEYPEIVRLAYSAREKSYSPYSGFAVGACVLAEDGKYYTGTNIENAAYGDTVCAERTAIFCAVKEGNRKISKLAIVGGKAGEECKDFCFPCGSCRQVISEFASEDFQLILPGPDGELKEFTLAEILPHHFGEDSLK
ncbi:MAG: cytidine deaminase [Lachnospiraceae bacterium]|nr:cytidine deaminase [Lachnospiraceae bacterium]